jgi:transposase
MSHHRDLTDVQWAVLDPLIPKPKRRKDGRGRPWRERREVLNGILFILRTGPPWADLPDRYPPYQTCHRRFQHWVRSGVIRGVLAGLAEAIGLRGRFHLEENQLLCPRKKPCLNQGDIGDSRPRHSRLGLLKSGLSRVTMWRLSALASWSRMSLDLRVAPQVLFFQQLPIQSRWISPRSRRERERLQVPDGISISHKPTAGHFQPHPDSGVQSAALGLNGRPDGRMVSFFRAGLISELTSFTK